MLSQPNIPISPSIQNVIRHGISLLSPRSIILFGSRARGDAHKFSDYDLAFDFEDDKKDQWTRFVLDVEELPLTLQHVDLVDLKTAPKELAKRIRQDGIVIYDREKV